MIYSKGNRSMVGLLGVATLFAASSALAAPPLPKPENSLLGVQLLSTYKNVMKRYGQPHEIQVGSPALPSQVPQNSGGASAGMSGMMGGMPGGMMGGMMGAGRRGMLGGPGGMMGGGALPGFAGGGKDQEGGGRRGMMAPPGAMGGGMAGLPGMSGGFQGSMQGGFPGGAMGGSPGMGGMTGGFPGLNGLDEPEVGSESTWWYHFPKRGIHFAFLFNKDGKVIQIQEYGWKDDGKTGGSKTRQGVGLGTTLGTVLQKYGWSNDGDRNGNNLVMRYGGRDRLALQLVKNAVVGITLAVVN